MSLQKLVSNCGDSKPKWNDLNKQKCSPTSFDSIDILKYSFFNTFLNPTDKARNKKKINKKTGSYWKNRTARYDIKTKENFDKDVDGLLSSALCSKLEFGNKQEDKDDYADVVMNKTKKNRKRIQLTKKKEISLKKSPPRKNKTFSNHRSHIDHSHPNKVNSMKINEKHASKSLEQGKETCNANYISLINTGNGSLIELTKNVTSNSSYIYKNDISHQESEYILESHKKPDKLFDNSEKINCVINSEHDIIQGIEHRVFDRLIISALSKINENKNLNSIQCVSKTKIVQDTFSPAIKSNDDHSIEISKTIIKMPSSTYSNEIALKNRNQFVSFSDTKAGKRKRKYNRQKNNGLRQREKYFIKENELKEGVVDHNIDDNEVYNGNVGSHNIHDPNINDTKVITNFLLSNFSSFVESISYPKFIDRVTHDSDATLRIKDDKNTTQKCDSVDDGTLIESESDTEQGMCSK